MQRLIRELRETPDTGVAHRALLSQHGWDFSFSASSRRHRSPNATASALPPGLKGVGFGALHMGDPIPYVDASQVLHLFFLQPPFRMGIPWIHSTSRDLLAFDTSLGVAIAPNGTVCSDVGSTFTGGVVRGDDGAFHALYTGWHGAGTGGSGCPDPWGRETMMHATSPDLVRWAHHDEAPLFPDGVVYNNSTIRNWRDGNPFRSPDGTWVMPLCSDSIAAGTPAVGAVISRDLWKWEVAPPLALSGVPPECPDVFQLPEAVDPSRAWYMLSGGFFGGLVYIKTATTPTGPWVDAPFPVADGATIYAGKHFVVGSRAVFIAWFGGAECGAVWAGPSITPREIYTDPTVPGQLLFRPIAEAVAALSKRVVAALAAPTRANFTLATPPCCNAAWHFNVNITLSGPADQVKVTLLARAATPHPPQTEWKGTELTLGPGPVVSLLDIPKCGCTPVPPTGVCGWTRNGTVPVLRGGATARQWSVRCLVSGIAIECFVHDAFAYSITQHYQAWLHEKTIPLVYVSTLAGSPTYTAAVVTTA